MTSPGSLRPTEGIKLALLRVSSRCVSSVSYGFAFMRRCMFRVWLVFPGLRLIYPGAPACVPPPLWGPDSTVILLLGNDVSQC